MRVCVLAHDMRSVWNIHSPSKVRTFFWSECILSGPHTFKIVFECSDAVLRMRLGLGLSQGLRGWKMGLLLFMGFNLGSKVQIGKLGLGI